MAYLPRSARRTMLTLVSVAVAALFTAGTVLASTPVTVGYRDHGYGGASRPSSDKPQSKLWYAGGSWWAGMFYNTTVTPKYSEFRIWKLNEATHTWAVQGAGTDTSTRMDVRDKSHADYLFDSNKLYVVSAHPGNADPTVTDDRLKFYRFSFAAGVYTRLSAAAIPGTTAGTLSATIAKASNGDLWTTWNSLGQIRYSMSTDDGASWSAAADLPAQSSPIKGDGTTTTSDTVAVVAFGANIGVLWSDHSGSAPPDNADNAFYFGSIAAGDDPTVPGNWTTTKLPTLVSPPDGEQADNHINVKVAADGTIYAVGKTGKDTANCATNTTKPLIEFFKRTTAGTWSVHLVSTVGDCQTRAQIALDEQLGVAYVLLTSPNGGGTIYRKSASLADLEFRGAADEGVQLGTPFIKSATETLIDDVSTTKQPVTAATGLVAIANNLNPSAARFYLHNQMALVASDSTAPSGTASINADAAFTKVQAVSVAVPATDTGGSGVTMVRLANVGTVNGGVLVDASARSFSYATPVAWTLAAGEGNKTVWIQWRDAAGNWSTPITETIDVDATAPTGGDVVINGDDATTETTAVTLDLTAATDGSGSGVSTVLVSNSADFTGASSFPFAASIAWTLPGGLPALKTVHVKFVDAAGNASAEVTDDITLSDTTAPGPGGVPVHTISGPVSGGVPLRLAWTASTASDLDHYLVTRSIDGGSYVQVGLPATTFFNMNLASGHTYRFRVYAVDHAGNRSSYRLSVSFKASNYSEANSAIRYRGTWSTASSTAYLNGKAKYSKTAGASATFTVTGNRIGWLSYRSPSSGTARVYINGTLVGTVNLFSSTYQTKALVFSKSYSSVATRTVKIVVSGTAGHPRVTLDSMFAFR